MAKTFTGFMRQSRRAPNGHHFRAQITVTENEVAQTHTFEGVAQSEEAAETFMLNWAKGLGHEPPAPPQPEAE